MNIPSKNGHYELKAGSNTLVIDIQISCERKTKLDKIEAGERSRIGGFKYVPKYSVKVLDANGNVIDCLPETFNKDNYINYVSSQVGKENGISSNPNEILKVLSKKLEKDVGLYIIDYKFNGIAKNKIKLTFYVDDWNANIANIEKYFESIGAICSIADKKKKIRASQCLVISVYLPLDFKLNESRYMKKIVRLTEGDLHRIVKESVRKILREYDRGEDVLLSTKTLSYPDAKEMAANYGMSPSRAAALWFENVMDYDDFYEGELPPYSDKCKKIRALEATMYYDKVNNCYFLVKDGNTSMIGFGENTLSRKIMREAVKKILRETDCAGAMQTGCGEAPKGTNPEAGQYTVPFGPDKDTSDRTPGFSVNGKAKWNKNTGNVQRRQIYNPKSGKKK